MAGRPARGDATAMRVLDVAERLVQVRGFNGFSYADVAAELGITKAALHYHFASKAALGEALIDRYCDRLAASLAALAAAEPSAAARLRGYAALYRDGLRGERLCLCGMLAAEYQTLPQAMRSAVIRFFTRNEAWLAGVLADGAAAGEIQLAGPPADTAVALIAGLEGAMLVTRPFDDVARFDAAIAPLLAGLNAPLVSARD
ncbi:MAG TPA: TetR/AcrR family transcriptional regulator [Streptosporangiaceae bacterium]|nr:TetR/AcrR family transcriptional regulator [Streptosporangiaceae bacterium]